MSLMVLISMSRPPWMHRTQFTMSSSRQPLLNRLDLAAALRTIIRLVVCGTVLSDGAYPASPPAANIAFLEAPLGVRHGRWLHAPHPLPPASAWIIPPLTH